MPINSSSVPHPMSRGRIVRWMLEEIWQPYRTELFDYDTTMKAAAPSRDQSNGKGPVPAIRHGDIVVTEAAAICAYLADVFPEARVAPPPGDRLRGPFYRCGCSLPPGRGGVEQQGDGFRRAAGRERMMGYGRVEDVVTALEGAVWHGEYLVGTAFTAADVYVGSGTGLGIQFGTIERRPLPAVLATAQRPSGGAANERHRRRTGGKESATFSSSGANVM